MSWEKSVGPGIPLRAIVYHQKRGLSSNNWFEFLSYAGHDRESVIQ